MAADSRLEQMRERCNEFHQQHPQVWELFHRFTMDRINRGFEHYSVNAIFERIRWETDQSASEPAEFKLNNNFRAFYARRWMKMHPEHDGFFRTRTQTSADDDASTLPELGPADYE